jgi:TRAP-type C4-dicarboxylate transport system substrate-binding protein
MYRRSPLAILLSVAIATASVGAHAADQAQLRFASPTSPQSKLNIWGFEAWIDDVQKASDGSLAVQLFPGPAIATINNVYDRITSGVADLGFGIFGPLAGKFTKVNVAGLPFEAKGCEEASVALSRLYERHLIDDEMQDVKTLALFTFPSIAINANTPIKTASDLRGLKVATSDRIMGEVFTHLGATPVVLAPPDYYQALSRSTVQAAAVGWTAIISFKLTEVTNYHADTDAGLIPAFVFMNKGSYARLPEAARATIDKYSGAPFFRRLGQVTDRQDRAGHEIAGAMPGQTITAIDAAEQERWRKMISPVVDEWVSSTKNGAQVLSAFREEVAKFRAAK